MVLEINRQSLFEIQLLTDKLFINETLNEIQVGQSDLDLLEIILIPLLFLFINVLKTLFQKTFRVVTLRAQIKPKLPQPNLQPPLEQLLLISLSQPISLILFLKSINHYTNKN